MKTKGDGSGLKLRRIFELHKMLRKSRRGCSAEQLTEACQEIDPGVDKRTIMNDLKFLRDELQAPLPERANKHYGYYYQQPYSILEGLDDSPLGSLNEALALLRQLAGTKEFAGMEELLLRLEQRVALSSAEPDTAISFDEAMLTGKEWLTSLYNAIKQKVYLRIAYQAFTQETTTVRHVFPLLLKEYNNRWFLIGWEPDQPTPQNLALDRITACRVTAETFTHPRFFNSTAYFEQVIGVTKTQTEPQRVLLRFVKARAQVYHDKENSPESKRNRTY